MAIQEAMPGRLGPYRLLHRIGEGGMGVVHLAADRANRLVAVKVLRAHECGYEPARRRLEREVESMRRVRNRFVLEVIDADLNSEVPYFVTRFVPGRSLTQVITESGPLSGTRLQRLAYGVADALAAAHAAGVVHRDIKPANVLMNGDDPLVIDFGVAAMPDQTPLTGTGIVIGTPGYVAPEVIEGQSCQPASDVHAWGATVAFAARGEPAYGTGSYEAVLYRIVRGDADLEGVPGALYPLVAAALLRKPSQRPSAAWLASQVAGLDLTVPGLSPTIGAHPRAQRETAAAIASSREWAVQQPQDFVGLLPPVPQNPVPKAPRAAQQRQDLVAAISGGVPGTVRVKCPPRRRGVLCFFAMLAAATISLALPIAGTAATVALLVTLRTTGCTRERAATRQRRRGPRRTDPLLLAVSLPLALTRSLVVTLLASPVLLILACLPAAALILALGRSQLPLAVACSGSTYTILNCIAPTSRAARRESERAIGAVTPTWLTRAAAALMLGAVAAAAVLATLASGPGYWPASGPQEVLRLVQTHRVTAGAATIRGRPEALGWNSGRNCRRTSPPAAPWPRPGAG